MDNHIFNINIHIKITAGFEPFNFENLLYIKPSCKLLYDSKTENSYHTELGKKVHNSFYVSILFFFIIFKSRIFRFHIMSIQLYTKFQSHIKSSIFYIYKLQHFIDYCMYFEHIQGEYF